MAGLQGMGSIGKTELACSILRRLGPAAEVTGLAAGYAADDARAMEELKAGLSFREALAKFAKI